MGATCSEGTLHLNEECIHIEPEWMDQARTKFMPIVTDFTRKSQPVIRYRLNDILTLRKTPCPCGSVMMALECIEGRADDVIYFTNSKGEEVTVFPDFIRRAIMTASDQIEEYQVIQKKVGELNIYLRINLQRSSQPYEAAVEVEILRLSQLLQAQPAALHFFTAMPPLNGKKLRRVMRDLTTGS